MATNYHDVLITEVLIGDRFRKDLGDIEALKASITDFGVLEPILLDRDNNLMAGGRRIHACMALGKQRIPALYFDEIDPLRAREIELEENIQRKDLTISEVVDLTEEIHRLKMARYAGQTRLATDGAESLVSGTQTEDGLLGRERAIREVPMWTQQSTAAILGVSPPTVSKHLALGDIFRAMPELRLEDETSAIYRKVDRRLEELEREWDYRQLKKSGKIETRGQILLGDCLIHLEKLDDSSVDCVIMDPPYGVIQPGGIGRYENIHFDDDPVAAMAHLRLVSKELSRVCKPNAHLYVFFGIKMWVETKGIFDAMNFDVDPIPLIWIKNTGSVIDWDFRFANHYEPIWFISNRTRRLAYKRLTGNVFTYDSVPSADRTNIAEKPLALIKELVMLSTTENELILDPYAGSGVVAVAAKECGRRFIVIEKDQDQWNGINVRVSKIADPPSQTSGPIGPTISEIL